MKHAILAGALGLVAAAAVTASAQGVAGAAKAAAVDAEMKAMDANRDGKVTAAEMDAAHAGITGGKPMKGEMSAADKIKTIDTDGDGALSAAEHSAGARKMFEAQDTNKDGFLGKDELAAGQAMKMRKGPQ